MPSYDGPNVGPPAPVAIATLRNPINPEPGLDVTVLLDTGAGITLLPRLAIEQMGVPLVPNQQYELMGFDGSKTFVPAVVLEMIFLKRTFRGRFLLIDEERGILGRDVLRYLTLVLDGPRHQWWEHSP